MKTLMGGEGKGIAAVDQAVKGSGRLARVLHSLGEMPLNKKRLSQMLGRPFFIWSMMLCRRPLSLPNAHGGRLAVVGVRRSVCAQAHQQRYSYRLAFRSTFVGAATQRPRKNTATGKYLQIICPILFFESIRWRWTVSFSA